MDPKSKTDLFTESDKNNLEKLPESEKEAFYRRFAEISMRRRLADDTWNAKVERIEEDCDALIADIKGRIALQEAINTKV